MATVSRTSSITSQKQQLPHVSALIQSAESRGTSFDARKTLSSQRTAKQRSTPSTPKNEPLDLRSTPNIHLLASLPDFYGEPQPAPTPLRRKKSSNSGAPSPASRAASIAEESIFELPSMPIESPNSSVAVSFVAELEDTSGLGYEAMPPLPVRSPLAPHSEAASILFKTNKYSSQAILKVVDEAIASIEAQNRELHARAEAAEASAYRLHVSNTELRNRIEELSLLQRPKPTIPTSSVATQTTPRVSPVASPRNSVEQSSTPVEFVKNASSITSQNIASRTGNNITDGVQAVTRPTITREPSAPTIRTAQLVQIVNLPPKASPLTSHPAPPTPSPPHESNQQPPPGIPQPKFRRSIRSLKFLQRSHADNMSMPLTPTSILNRASRQSSDRPRTADASSPSVGTSHFQKLDGAPPLPELPIFLSLTTGDSAFSETSTNEDGKRSRRLTRTVSFEEARKIADQMETSAHRLTVNSPPGEISPSPIDGVVEIGAAVVAGEKDSQGESKPLRSQRSRVRFLLKDNSIKDFMRDRESQRERKEKKHAWLKWGKKGEEVAAA